MRAPRNFYGKSTAGKVLREITCRNPDIDTDTIQLTPGGKRIYYVEEDNRGAAILADISQEDIAPLRRFLLPQDEVRPYISQLRYAPDGSKLLVQTQNATYLYDIRDLTSTVQDAKAYE